MNSSPHRAANAITAAAPPITHCAFPVIIGMPPVLTLDVLTATGVSEAELLAECVLVEVVFGAAVIVDEDNENDDVLELAEYELLVEFDTDEIE